MTSRQPTSPVASSQVLLRSAERLCYTRFLMGILLSVVSPTGWAQTQGAGYPPAGYYPQASQYPTAGRYPAPSPYPIPSQSPVQQGYPSASQYPAQRQNYPTPAYRAPTQRTSSRSTAPQNPGYGIYQVKPGDTLWRIAMNHRVSPGEIMAANSMSNDTVLVGQSLIIPGRGQSTQSVPAQYPAAPSYPVAPPPKTSYPSSVTSGGYHTIRPGDTFSEIALRYHVSQTALQKANPGIDPNRIPAGGVLVIPGGKTTAVPVPTYPQQPVYTPVPPKPAPKAPVPSGDYHTVNRGETLSVIAAKYHVSTSALAKANGITNPNLIEIGQPLKIPASSRSTNIAGNAPAKKPVVPVKKTPKPAPIPTQTYTPPAPATGLAAKAPTYPEPDKPTATPAPVEDSHRGVLSYRVDRTDSIESIASMFGTTPSRIRQMNQMSANATVKPADEILVPAMGAVSLQ